MSELFLKILNMSISAGWLVLAVLVLRLMLKKASKWVNVLLWGMVAVRLVFPFSIESIFSLIPSGETVPTDIMFAHSPAIDSGIDVINHVVNPAISSSFAPTPGDSVNPLQVWLLAAVIVWIAGIAMMASYTAISYHRLRNKAETAVLYRNNIFQSERVASPFVLGVFRPRIYLPFRLDEQDMAHIIAHEQAHIRRKDHWWKPLGFLLLTVHWFNPLMWLAYVLLCRDIELSCDERVIKELGNEQRADYTQALVTCSVRRRAIAACPLAFGEVGVKERVKSVMNYRKPGFWVIAAAVTVCIATAVCFLTNPIERSASRVIGYSALYTEALIDDAMDIAQREFEKQFPGCVLTELRYDEEVENRALISYLIEYYGKRGQELLPVVLTYRTADGDAESRALYLLRTEDKTSWEYAFSGPYEKRISLNDIIILSQYGYDLHWSDFEDYSYMEIGSGLYIRVYEINEMYELRIGGTDTDSDPMYIYLALADDLDTRIDIRDGGVTEFLEQNNQADTDTTNHDLQLQLVLPKHQFEAGEPIECKAVLTYVGEEDSVTIFYNNPIVIFTLDGGEYFRGDRYGWAVRDVYNAPAVTRTLKKGEPLEIPYQKQQHQFTGLMDDAEKAFWEDYKASPELTLEPGKYEMIVHFAYSLKRVTAHGPFEKIDVSETIIVE